MVNKLNGLTLIVDSRKVVSMLFNVFINNLTHDIDDVSSGIFVNDTLLTILLIGVRNGVL